MAPSNARSAVKRSTTILGADGLGQEGRVECFLKNRSKIERMARTKYLSWPIEEPNVVLIKSADAQKLLGT